MNNTEKRVKKVVYNELGSYVPGVYGPTDIKLSHSFVDDLQADSLDAVELIMALEEEFETEIPDDVAEGFKTVGDVVGYFEG